MGYRIGAINRLTTGWIPISGLRTWQTRFAIWTDGCALAATFGWSQPRDEQT